MAPKRHDKKPKPVEEWDVEEWKIAYSVLNDKYEHLRRKMRLAINSLNTAI